LRAKANTAGLRTASQVKLGSWLWPCTKRVATAKGTENLAAKVLRGAGSINSEAML
jgi:hypothetical protein